MESKILEIPRFKNPRKKDSKKKLEEKKKEEERNVCAKKYKEHKITITITIRKKSNRKC